MGATHGGRLASRPRRAAALAGHLVALCMWTQPAAAQSAAPEARVVVVDTAGDRELEATIAELLARGGLRTARAGEGVSGPVVARVRVDRDSEGARIVVRSAAGDRAERHVARATSDTLYRETIAHAVRSTVEPLAERPPETTAPERAQDAPPPALRPAATGRPSQGPPKASPSPVALVVRAEAGAALTSPQTPSFPARAEVGAELRGPLRPSAFVGAGYALAPKVDAPGVTTSLTLVPIRARVAVEPIGSERVAMVTALHGGVDVASVRAAPSRPTVRAEGPEASAQPIVGASLGARVRVARTVDIGASLGLDVDLAPRRFTVDRGPSRDAVLELGRLRPFAVLHVTWGPFGFAGLGAAEATP